MSRFYDVREPIEYVVNQYFQKKKGLNSNYEDENFFPEGGDYVDDDLPEYPITIIRDRENRAYKFIYGNVESLLEDEEADPLIWQQELVREDGVVVSIITTYPDGEEVENTFIRDDGRVINIT